VRVAGPRDQAESGAAAADPQSYITADDRRKGYADLGVSATLDPLANSRFFGQLARRFALYFVVSNAVGVGLLVLGLIITATEGGVAALGNGGGAVRATGLISALVTITLMAMFLFMPVPALLGQWSRTLTFQAPASRTAVTVHHLDHHDPSPWYECWYISQDGRQAVSAGTFIVPPSGSGTFVMTSAADPNDFPDDGDHSPAADRRRCAAAEGDSPHRPGEETVARPVLARSQGRFRGSACEIVHKASPRNAFLRRTRAAFGLE
jgi:hypothetical protein